MGNEFHWNFWMYRVKPHHADFLLHYKYKSARFEIQAKQAGSYRKASKESHTFI